MSELDPDSFDEAQPVVLRPRMPVWKRVLIGIAAFFAVLVVVAVMLFFYGGMSSSANDPAIKQQYEQLVAAGQVQPVQKRFVIPIPGCTCHSSDPYLTEQHRNRRMRECAGCHSR